MDDESETTGSTDVEKATRRRWPIRLAIGIILIVVLSSATIVWSNRLDFAYEAPEGTVAPGEQVTISDPGGDCGPLIVSIWEPGGLGQWNRTHNGSAVGDSFSRDAHRWWKFWESESYFTGVPCALNGEMAFTLPSDVASGTVAVCDSDRRCAKVEVG